MQLLEEIKKILDKWKRI